MTISQRIQSFPCLTILTRSLRALEDQAQKRKGQVTEVITCRKPPLLDDNHTKMKTTIVHEIITLQYTGSSATVRRGGRNSGARGRARGRGGSRRGRGNGRGCGRGGRRRGPTASSLPWQTAQPTTDVTPTAPTFTATPGGYSNVTYSQANCITSMNTYNCHQIHIKHARLQ